MRPPSDAAPKSGVAGRRSSHTAFLDGLRGVAAFIVFVHHISKDPFPWLPWGWGSDRNDVTQYYLLQLPIVRIIHSGPSLVAIFFVVSGFALSCSPLQHIRRRDQESLARSLASSAFRRVIRLYLPCIVTSFFMMLAVQLHIAPFPAHRPREDNIFLELNAWLISLWALLNPFDLSFTLPRYDDNLWTIPAELRGSMVLYITVLMVSRLRRKFRLIIELTITFWFFSYGLWDIALFTMGLVLAEIHLEREDQLSQNLPPPSSARSSNSGPSKTGRLLVMLSFFLSLHLTSAPLIGFRSSFGYSWIASLTPASWIERGVSDRWLPTLGAPLLVFCAGRSRRLRSLFTSSIASYLGRISFGLYLTHGPVRYTAYHPLLRNIMGGLGLVVRSPDKEIEAKHGWLKAVTWISDIGKDKEKAMKVAEQKADTATLDWRFIIAVGIAWSIIVPATIALADFFTRTVDEPSVGLSRKIEAKLTDEHFSSKYDDNEHEQNNMARTPKESDVDHSREKFH